MSADYSLFVLIGPGGVGKGTIARELVERDPQLWLSRSWTSRPPRTIETGKEYYFVSRDEFEAAIAAGEFFEWAEFLNNLYGTPKPVPPKGADVLLEIEVQGALQVKTAHPEATVILLLPPSLEELELRLRGRGDSEEHVNSRLTSSAGETALGYDIASHVIVNDDLEASISQIQAIIEGLRRDRRRPAKG